DSTGPLTALTRSTVTGDSGPDMASFMVCSASPDSELHPVTPAMAMPSTTVRRMVFTWVSSVVTSHLIFGSCAGIENGCCGQQLTDETVPACYAGRANKHHILRLHLELIGQDKGRRGLRVQLEHGRLLGLDILDTANHIDFLAAG